MAASNPSYELGRLVGGPWIQYASSVGQDFYYNEQTRTIQYAIPTGYADQPADTWSFDTSKSWRQWRNQRTGRITLIDPNPPPPRNYLDLNNVKAYMKTVEETPKSPEYLYRRVMTAIIKSVFKESEGFDVTQEETRGVSGASSIPDIIVLKIIARVGGSMYPFDYCMIESKALGESWGGTEGQLSLHCQGTDNPSEQVYGIVHVGMHIQVYTADQGALTAVSDRMHLRNNVTDVTNWLQNIKHNPLRFS